MRVVLTYIAIVAFALTGVVGLAEHNLKAGVATLLLAAANALLLL